MEIGANGVPMVLVPYHVEVGPKQEHELVLTPHHLEVAIPALAVLHRQLPAATQNVQASYRFLELYLDSRFY